MSALQGQVGGDHYKTMRMQPFEFTMANHWDPLAHTILKYVSRHQAKGGAADLLKARHCTELRAELIAKYSASVAWNVIPMAAYLTANNMPAEEAQVLTILDAWVAAGYNGNGPRLQAHHLDRLIQVRYPNHGVLTP